MPIAINLLVDCCSVELFTWSLMHVSGSGGNCFVFVLLSFGMAGIRSTPGTALTTHNLPSSGVKALMGNLLHLDEIEREWVKM
jgi:hypothetical protein